MNDIRIADTELPLPEDYVLVECWQCHGSGGVEVWEQYDALGGEWVGDECPTCLGEGTLTMFDWDGEYVAWLNDRQYA